ncbi:ABC transporter substrate-binding protein [Halapricum salinum]|uniref:ABC transporter substrate-binding protein n=1 Tax=Halapricum salinum TaxID=1457250 RepID=A0A4D6HFB4_9EURY|nr:ABC transporter substrate-binding protein [Halapricum salinum]
MDAESSPRHGLTRRRALAGGALAASGLSSGCVETIERFFGGSSREQVSLEIVTVPADADARLTAIARTLVDRLEAVGIATDFLLTPTDQLRKKVLTNRDFDVYIGTMAADRDPDYLRTTFQSSYSNGVGWQNPFGFTDQGSDSLLDAQRYQSGQQRRETIQDALTAITGEQPIVPLLSDTAIAAVRRNRFEGWDRVRARDPLWLLALDPAPGRSPEGRLRMTAVEKILTERLNPLLPTFSEFDALTAYLYDPLGRYYDGQIRPWLAQSWSIDESAREIRLELHPDLTWHDGEALTAADVQFTYRFLNDTAMGTGETRHPAPRFRRQSSLVDAVDVLDDQTVRISVDAAPAVARTVLTAPLLPEHVWESRTDVVDESTGLTQAVTWDNPDPVGAGTLAFESRTVEESLVLTRNSDHPMNREGTALFERFGPLAFDSLRFRVVPSDLAGLSLLTDGDVDATVPKLGNDVISNVRNESAVDLVTSPSRTVYHVGFNARRRPLQNPGFRRAIARLFDKGDIVESTFDGHADPLTTPVTDAEWIPSSLAWNGSDPEVPFAGSGGEFDVERAKQYFEDAGFQYTNDGRLVY